MKLEFDLSKNDHLQYQLYKASKRKRIKNSRLRSRIIYAVLFFSIGVYNYFKNNNVILYIIVFGILSVIIFFIEPLLTKILYKRHYSKSIDEFYKETIGKKCPLEIFDGFILSKGFGSESEAKIDIKEIKEIIEINTNYFIDISNVSSIILPKNINTNDFIEILMRDYNIKLNKELNWKWK